VARARRKVMSRLSRRVKVVYRMGGVDEDDTRESDRERCGVEGNMSEDDADDIDESGVDMQNYW
jgi:hypothetical protein